MGYHLELGGSHRVGGAYVRWHHLALPVAALKNAMLNNLRPSITQLDLFTSVLDRHLENFNGHDTGLENPCVSLAGYNVEVVLLVDHVDLLLVGLPRGTVAKLLLVCACMPDIVTVLASLLVEFLS